ncbi:uncharacterized protein LOC127840051 [Dreissena polymorpha]|uniref:Mab-21-like HhH/H2TH-like domain-containing protein n=1 Tax=Dreissena polymorpha TaxID=45954 RepID=A0A9D4J1D1_DREPO|nr:uncharacterized protein LOC127840051 [Dreissena polymorpha]KAH3792244.1 hypothetical protein DPMN_145735 [Dreissena polymorpha]
MEIPEHFTELSIRFSEVLDDSGAGKETVLERRRIFLWRESMETIAAKLWGDKAECFHFGSQTEGTTTPGLQSDIDILCSNHCVNIMTFLGDWKARKNMNFLMLYDETMPPQQYLLQVIQFNTPSPETSRWFYNFVRKESGQVLYSAERCKQDQQHLIWTRGSGMTTEHGPSVSWVPNWDIVQAFHVLKQLPEIQHWINRCRGKPWPPVQVLEAARVAPCFLLPACHPDSVYKREEWRLSSNLIERMLMFSLNMTQIKCYIALKLIRKSLFANIVGDYITSFHCKTIIFYTIERTRPSLWVEHNLMFLLWLCLNVLRQCLRCGRLPHYIIEGVNLFDGKLSKVKQRRLYVFVDSMIKKNLHYVFYIGIDDIGCRLQDCSMRRVVQVKELQRFTLCNRIRLVLKYESLKDFFSRLLGIIRQLSSNTTFEVDIQHVLRIALESYINNRLKTKITTALKFIKHIHAFYNSTKSSDCLRLQNVVNTEIISRFQYSLNTDVASSRLKMASILYCSGHIHAAVKVLEDVDNWYHIMVKAVCGCRYKDKNHNLHQYANMLSGNSDKVFLESPFAFCVTFCRRELYCTPCILLFEMNRNITDEEVALRGYVEKGWMVTAEVDARSFLHYLQYLTYRALGDHDNTENALGRLGSCIYDEKNKINLYHPETTLNLLGHCYEMEGDYELALELYEKSLQTYGKNNAANWHVRRVRRLVSG